MTAVRRSTPTDEVAERHLDRSVAHDPLLATYIGVAGHDGELPSFDPDWLAERSAQRRATLRELDAVQAQDADDRITAAALREEIEVEEQLRAFGTEESLLDNVSSPVQTVRDSFDLNPTADVEDWTAIAARLAAVPAALHGYTESLRLAASRGQVSARRQVEAAVGQAEANVGPDGFFAAFAAAARLDGGADLPATLRAEVAANAERAGNAYAELAATLREELLPVAPERDAVGRELYEVCARRWLGAQIDLDEAYEWGQQELARIVELMAQTAERIRPGASVAETIAALDTDSGRQLEGTDALQAWMQQKSDAAVDALADTHFDIPEPIRRLECRIAPTATGGVYYSGPSEDLVTRPGRMWWSVPVGDTMFNTWKELTTIYHEGVPGHHLQIAQTVYRADILNRWRRLGCWTSGYGEGWALYAEQLMAELGFLDDPADFLGMLDGQSLRAARVVLDIGVHCGLPAPAEVGGGDWDYDKAWRFLSAHCNASEGFRRYELDRYLGWPGQAPSYKLGQRPWLRLREDIRAREGDAFDLKSFHRRALDLGSVGLDVLRAAMLDEYA